MTLAPRLAVAIVLTGLAACTRPAPTSPESPAASGATLPSWHEGPSKTALTSFVSRVTTPGNPDFVAASARIAVFDNDGTLWAEQRMYFQLAFALDRVKALAAQHPEWQKREPFKSVMTGDLKAVASGGEHALSEIIAASHAGNTTAEFEQIVKDWVTRAKHPKTGRLYTEMVAFGNSDGDFEMLEWTTTAPGPRLGVIVHHTDAQREWAYDRESSVGRLVRGLDEAAARRWVVVDMKDEWAQIFPWAE